MIPIKHTQTQLQSQGCLYLPIHPAILSPNRFLVIRVLDFSENLSPLFPVSNGSYIWFNPSPGKIPKRYKTKKTMNISALHFTLLRELGDWLGDKLNEGRLQ
jgi:hypothetical protein